MSIPLFVLIMVVLLFGLGYILAPKGTLTKIASTFFIAFSTIYDWLQEQFHILAELVPPEWVPWFLGTFLGLTLLAVFRPESAVRK